MFYKLQDIIMIKKFSFMYLMLLVSFNIESQSLSKSVIGSSGGNLTNSIQLNFTVGESVIATFQNPILTLGQGFINQRPWRQVSLNLMIVLIS